MPSNNQFPFKKKTQETAVFTQSHPAQPQQGSIVKPNSQQDQSTQLDCTNSDLSNNCSLPDPSTLPYSDLKEIDIDEILNFIDTGEISVLDPANPDPNTMRSDITSSEHTTTTSSTHPNKDTTVAHKDFKHPSGKQISRDSRVYTATSGDETQENMTDGGNHSTCGGSDYESEQREVFSPVSGNRDKSPPQYRKSRKHKRRHSSSSSSSEERPRHRKEKDDVKKKKKSPNAHKERSSKSQRSSITPDRSSMASKEQNEPTTAKRTGVRLLNVPEGLFRHPNPPPEKAMLNTNMIFDSVMKRKLGKQLDTDALSETTVASRKSVRRTPTREMGEKDMEKHLAAGICRTELTRKTLMIIKRYYKGKDLVRTLTYIHQAETEPVEDENSIQIDSTGYLFYSLEVGAGITFTELSSNDRLLKQSLVQALFPDKMCDAEHSLDLVFRKVLRDISEEIYDIDEEKPVDIKNPILISARYVELRTLQKIRDYYREVKRNDNVFRTILEMDFGDPSDSDYLANSACRFYIRKLMSCYEITPSNFDEKIHNTISTPDVMRVWTDTENQQKVNVQIVKNITTAFNRTKAMEKNPKNFARHFIESFIENTAPFFMSHSEFLSRVVNGSELFAWLCFGITTNERNNGAVLMAQSFLLMKKDEADRRISWNYPLASIVHRHQSQTPKRIALDMQESISKFCDSYEYEF